MAAAVAPAEVAAALSWARTAPLEAAEALKRRLSHYRGKEYFPPERTGTCVVTKEGKPVVEEAIAYLEALGQLGSVGEASEVGLALAAEDHVVDIGYTGAVSHASSDGTNSYDRALRYGTMRSFGESLWYGSAKADARCIVLDLIVDDGVEGRGHRHCVCNPSWEVVGVAYGPHAIYGRLAAMEFASGWHPNDLAISVRQQSGPVKVAGQEESRRNVTTQWKVIGTCPVCKEAIRGGAVVEIEQLGGKLHKQCFNCSTCSMPLSGVPFNVHEQVPFCRPCFFEQHGEKCTACSKAMSGGMVKCALGKFHVECLVCTTCSKAIGKSPFSTQSGAITCQACAGLGQAGNAVGRRPASMGAAAVPLGAVAGNNRLRSSGPSASRLAASLSSPVQSKALARSSQGARLLGSAPQSHPESPVATRAASPAGVSAAGRAAARPKARAKDKPSLTQAGATVVGLGVDYGNL